MHKKTLAQVGIIAVHSIHEFLSDGVPARDFDRIRIALGGW